jgi:hypothetical protein
MPMSSHCRAGLDVPRTNTDLDEQIEERGWALNEDATTNVNESSVSSWLNYLEGT